MKFGLKINFASIRNSFKNKKFKYGGYATLMTAVVIAIVIVINLVVDQINWKADLTQNQMFSLSEQTYKVLDNLEQDIKIIGLYETGKEERVVTEIIDRYLARSKRITYTTIDPERYPQLVAKYEKDGQSLSTGSLIVESGDRYKIINRYDLVNYSFSNTSGQFQAQSLAAEQRLTGAILYVTAEDLPVVYLLEGHGEDSLPYDITKQLEIENFTTESLNLLTEDAVPEDAHSVIIFSPKRDLTKDEEEKLRKYMENQGRAIFIMQYLNQELPNFQSLLKSYGVTIDRSVVIEGDNSMHAGNPLYLVPELGSHSIVSPLKSGQMYMLVPGAQSIQILDVKKRSLKIEPLLVTSENSWAKVNMESATLEKEEGDLEGPFNIAVAITDEIYEGNEKKETKLVVVGNAEFLSYNLVSQVPGNANFLLNSLNWLQDREENISIRPKSLTVPRLNIKASQQLILAGVVIILIPLAILASGLIVWLRRRHL
ncbi:MAG: GldG family protein [Clostridiales bacterium]|jgi:ABC-type uncharacterized transport system involved in gliding motility auxiliary subunit|nr:GldG family protein [Clostridiales bacterium]